MKQEEEKEEEDDDDDDDEKKKRKKRRKKKNKKRKKRRKKKKKKKKRLEQSGKKGAAILEAAPLLALLISTFLLKPLYRVSGAQIHHENITLLPDLDFISKWVKREERGALVELALATPPWMQNDRDTSFQYLMASETRQDEKEISSAITWCLILSLYHAVQLFFFLPASNSSTRRGDRNY
ncbi:hypothetical protein H6P81_015229 [Aristolochia fimbriata]|uniref:Uncharacterized protein n=1 Tax=Aristolochia fimbriata TaxID=158543 RepID=A0AAV7E6S9_ARIFI|nr:hypothetical protein H6P81_015229 [Aristolochia fimbriata]